MKQPDQITIRRVLNETASPDEAALVAAWFATNEGQQWLSTEFNNDIKRMDSGILEPLHDLPSDELLHSINRKILWKKRIRVLSRIAAVFIPCFLIITIWINLNNRLGGILLSTDDKQTISTTLGQRKELIFQDGTHIYLNSGSSLTYPKHWGYSERKVKLEGEAYFEVAHNPQRPFIVETPNETSVQVLGTKFDVKAYSTDESISVTLIQGSVKFFRDTISYLLTPSQQLIFNTLSKKISIKKIDNPFNSTLWSHNTIYFRDAPMKEVLKELERWYNVKIEIKDPSIYKYNFSLRTQNLPLSELLLEMENIAPIQCHINGQDVTIVKKDTNSPI